MRRAVAGTLAAALLAVALTGCSGGGETKLTVFAASSLNGTFTTLADRFEKTHPGVDVVLSPSSSTTLAEQVVNGAPADVLATADKVSMAIATKAGDTAGDAAGRPVEFATNTLVIAVPPGNPGHLTGVASLTGASFVMCDPSAPCGAAAKQMLARAGVSAQPKSYQPDVASTLTTVETGEVDAGIVYVTDAKAAGSQVDTVAIPSGYDVTNPYLLAAVKGAAHPELAREWIALVRSPAGQAVLQRAGFGRP